MGRKARMKRERRGKGGHAATPARRRWRELWAVGLVFAALAVAAGAGAWLWSGAGAAPQPAPQFNLLASTGRPITIEEFVGKQPIVLLFYMGAG